MGIRGVLERSARGRNAARCGQSALDLGPSCSTPRRQHDKRVPLAVAAAISSPESWAVSIIHPAVSVEMPFCGMLHPGGLCCPPTCQLYSLRPHENPKHLILNDFPYVSRRLPFDLSICPPSRLSRRQRQRVRSERRGGRPRACARGTCDSTIAGAGVGVGQESKTPGNRFWWRFGVQIHRA